MTEPLTYPLITPASNGYALIIEAPAGLVATLLDAGQAERHFDSGTNYVEDVSHAPYALAAVRAALGEDVDDWGLAPVVSGEWLLGELLIEGTVSDYTYDAGYLAVEVRPWSGGVEPIVSRSVAERIVSDHADGDAPDRFAWDGDAIVYQSADDELDPERIEPDADGHYNVGFGWTWEVVPAGRCDLVYGP